MNFDSNLLHWLNSLAGISETLDTLIVFLAIFFWYWMIVGVLAFVAVSLYPKFRDKLRKNIELLIIAAVSAFLARFAVVELIRFFYIRPRPYLALDNIYVLPHQLLGNMATSGAFPSGHASLSFAVAMAVSFYYPKTSILFFVVALAIGLGRVAAGVHWPSDILGGAIIGVGTAWLLRLLFLWYKKRRAMPSAYV
jgi:undecaprenyl-diphosphatase